MSKSKAFTPSYRFTPLATLGTQTVRMTPDPIESYSNRKGYEPAFIEDEARVPLPVLGDKLRADAATYKTNGKSTFVLPYTHFSTAISKSRRMPIFSAVNINGKTLKKVDRGDVWKFDPRIPQKYQILKEIYGNERDGYFSRGHMTRRMDPDWGPNSVAVLADADTFHATNAAPQVQNFNAGLWGDIEDYILANTTSDKMKVNVFTGPIFSKTDPVVHGIKIPVRFWKIVSFVHDETGQLTATGYVASQAKAIADLKPAFVFGDFENQQRPIVAIEKLTGLSFGSLKEIDVLSTAGNNFATSLRKVSDIMLA